MKQILFLIFFSLIFFACTNDNEENYFGCMDITAMNYDPAANVDDNSCLFSEGCMDEDACNFNQYALIDDESCEYPDTLVYQTSKNNNIATIIANKCLTCHADPSNFNAYDYPLDYQGLQIYGTELIAIINGTSQWSEAMPPSGATQLTDCEKLEIEIWINNGHEPGL